MFGSVKVGERGQIVIPKEAREIFGIKPGDLLLVLGDEARGLAIVSGNDRQGNLPSKFSRISVLR